jgi:hypothetical protein
MKNWRISRAFPAVIGVAIDVPLIWCAAQVSVPTPTLSASSVRSTGPEYADMIKSPGATTSGLILPSTVGPRELKQAKRLYSSSVVSSLSSKTDRVWVAPTVRAFLEFAGATILCNPSKPF